MTISKRLRYEILRRDDHTCRYCGASAPDVHLTIDHVLPVALGGGDQPENLVAACIDCNAGKSSVPPGAPLVANVSADAERWARAARIAATGMAAMSEQRTDYLDEFDAAWIAWKAAGEEVPRPNDWRSSLMQFHDAGLPIEIVSEAVTIAMSARKVSSEKTWRYFCGVCWKRVEELREETLLLLETPFPGGDDG